MLTWGRGRDITYDKGRRIVKEHAQSKGLDLVRRDWCDLSKDVGQLSAHLKARVDLLLF